MLGCASVRFSADAVLMSAPLLTRTVALVLAAAGYGRSPRRTRGSDSGVGMAVAGSVLLLALTSAPRLERLRAGHPVIALGIEPGLVPMGAITFVEQHGLRERMYNDFETGSYLIFEGYPRYRVFVDPRLPAYPEAFHALLGNFDLTRAEWDAAMSRIGVDSALLTYAGLNRRVSWWDPARWALVYRAEDARVFVRRLPRWNQLIAEFEIPATFSFTVEDGTVTHPLEAQPEASTVPACEWQRRLGDIWFELEPEHQGLHAEAAYRRALDPPGCLPSRADEARLAGWLGALDLAAGKVDRSISYLTRALAILPNDDRARAARARALIASGRQTEAVADWSIVEATSKDPWLRSLAGAKLRSIRESNP